MKPTALLLSEHRVIEQMLSVLEKLASQLASQEDQLIDEADAGQLIHFFQQFADRCHHAKEESLLFPALERKGFPRQMGPIGVRMHEHDLGRNHLRSMAEALAVMHSGNLEARNLFLQHAQAYINLLRDHIYKEDHILFVMAEQVLPAQEQEQILHEFQQVEHTVVAAGEHNGWVQTAHRLAHKYGLC
ncbi:MAG: hemerythrin domain-containing protein [Thermoguttaceae bacterium]|nr:hemerythrin domain-containing protein [Thermoguttaceae bacterium]MDW8036506.1 hemerythrin domain-containing protein [Thermoguttaceae bacterium]